MKPINPKSVRNRLERDFTPFSSNMVGEKLSQDQNIHKKQTLKQLWRLKIKSLYESTCKGLSNKRVRLLYQDEAGFGRISKPSACWAPRGMRPTVPCHHVREFRYCYGAVDAHTGDAFLSLQELVTQLGWTNFYSNYPPIIRMIIWFWSWIMLVFIPRTSWMNSATLFLTPTALFTRFESYWASLGYLEKKWQIY